MLKYIYDLVLNIMKFYFVLIIGLLLLTGCQTDKTITVPSTNTPNLQNNVDNQNSEIVFPVGEFKERITKKSFGDYITPETSPIQPERFKGYHTGVDVEYGDTTNQIPVVAITDGEVVMADWVSGYGGVVVIRYNINNKNYLATYGHLNPDSLPEKNKIIKSGEQIGILGAGYNNETDGERKHLHFAVYTSIDLNLRGYVQTKEDLKKWIDPLILFP